MAAIPPVAVPIPPAPVVAAVAAYVPVIGGANFIANGITEADAMIQILWWIGFRDNAQTVALFDDGVDSWDSIRMLSKSDIEAMAKSFASRTAAGGRIIFGTNRTKWLKALVHWTQDFTACLTTQL